MSFYATAPACSAKNPELNRFCRMSPCRRYDAWLQHHVAAAGAQGGALRAVKSFRSVQTDYTCCLQLSQTQCYNFSVL